MLKHTIIALAAMGAGLVGLAGGASAFPVSSAPAADGGSHNLLTEVRHRGESHSTMRYDRNRHGMRCGRWSDRCRYRYGGYYYQNPWWLFPTVGVGIALGAGSAYGGYDGYGGRHVAWCLDRYRSYNPRYNTWVSYSGRVRQCISPYGP